ncbi:MAG: hypothetical protein Q7R85_01335 [bacterium]|nr:hypothetical protein [bacterium]
MHKAIDMSEAKNRLRRLRDYIPACNMKLRDFGASLSAHLFSRLTPYEFVEQCQLALHEFPYCGDVSLQGNIPHIAEAIFSTEFASEVKSEHAEYLAKRIKELEHQLRQTDLVRR